MKVVIVGGGVAGLMCASSLVEKGCNVTIIDHAKKLGQKWLLACSSGMNLSVNLTPHDLSKSFYPHQEIFKDYFTNFGPSQFNTWLQKWGFSLKKGNGKRLFAEGGSPKEFLDKIEIFLATSSTCKILTNTQISLLEKSKNENKTRWKIHTDKGLVESDIVVFACGGLSYPKTGSNGAWTKLLTSFNIHIQDFEAANCALKVNWSKKMNLSTQYQYIKNISVNKTRGDLVLTPFGIEGAPVYPYSSKVRKQLNYGKAYVSVDLFPDRSQKEIELTLANNGGQGKQSFSSWIKKRLHISKEAFTLLMECTTTGTRGNTKELANALKNLKIELIDVAPIERAISSSGGVKIENLDTNLESINHKGLYFCGEMIDVDPPTGGYLIQMCFTTANIVAQAISLL